MRTKICTKCNTEYPNTLEYFYKHKSGKAGLASRCKQCGRERSREYRKLNPHRWRETTWGLAVGQYNKMLKQQSGICAICGLPEIIKDKRHRKIRELAVDHNHNTNKIRGLLCQKCNTMLGMADVDNQSIELLCSAISYIRNTDGVINDY